MKNKGGRKALGDNKRDYAIKVRFNPEERKQLFNLVESYDLDVQKRGVVGPFLRRLILEKQALQLEDHLPDDFANLIFQINKIGVNINQISKVANYKNLRSPSSKLELELERSNELIGQLLELLNDKLP